ncbi:sugar phosphate nucleotidyltransferase [Spongiivirga citrea]|uniref:NTP transferase domain-containing protein n=1 Tax=Spongiivirga citrea TaxID=1481457 RepID=A0A6M0CL44_9FLAO|nr:sugar phosphate nucleotidyltransferase [Spongiivirga citrea]NER18675.1 NTP transferase domain-containing protein [Spongiivirga citrea]
MDDNKLIILAAGASSRMKNSKDDVLDSKTLLQANQRTKGLIDIDNAGRPLLDFLLYNAKKAGYTNIFIVINAKDELIKKHYGSKLKGNSFNGLTISYAIQHIPPDRTKPLGTADAVAQTLQQYPELQKQYFTVCNSDNLYSENAFKQLIEVNEKSAFIAYNRGTLQFKSNRINQFALVALDQDNYLQDIIEKPLENDNVKYEDSQGVLRVSMNIFKFYGPLSSHYLLNCPISEKRKEKELPTALLNMVNDHQYSIIGIPMSEHVPDMTSKEDITIMRVYIQDNYPDFNWE